MRLLVVGGTSRTGRHVVTQGWARGHSLAVFCRDRARLGELDRDGLEVFTGDARRVEDLLPALAGRDAVISIVSAATIGPSTVSSDATLALIRAMPEAGVGRLAITSSRSIVAVRPRLALAITWWVFREAYRDLARAEGMLQASGLDWRIVRAVMLRDGPGKGRYHVDRERDVTAGDWRLDRADYARALLDVIEDPELSRVAVGVGGAA